MQYFKHMQIEDEEFFIMTDNVQLLSTMQP